MFLIKSVYCRMFQAAFRMALPLLPYREPKIINSCKELGKVLEKENLSLSRNAEKEANPLYPVPKLMTRKELESFFTK